MKASHRRCKQVAGRALGHGPWVRGAFPLLQRGAPFLAVHDGMVPLAEPVRRLERGKIS